MPDLDTQHADLFARVTAVLADLDSLIVTHTGHCEREPCPARVTLTRMRTTLTTEELAAAVARCDVDVPDQGGLGGWDVCRRERPCPVHDQPSTPPAVPSGAAPAAAGPHPDTPDRPGVLGRARKLIREWLRADPDIGHQHGFVDLLADVAARAVAPLLVSPAAGRVLDAAQRWQAAYHSSFAPPILTGNEYAGAMAYVDARAELLAAVDALDGDQPTANLAAASRGLATEAALEPDSGPVATAVSDLSGSYPAPHSIREQLATSHPHLTPAEVEQVVERYCSPRPWETGAPEPDSGPRWDRERITELIAAARRERITELIAAARRRDPMDDESDQIDALLADRDRLAQDLDAFRLGHQRAVLAWAEKEDRLRTELAEEQETSNQCTAAWNTERNRLEAEVAEVTADRAGLAAKAAAMHRQRDAARGDLAEARTELVHIRDALTNARAVASDRTADRDKITRDIMAERDAARGELAEAKAELERWRTIRTFRRWRTLPPVPDVPDALPHAAAMLRAASDEELPEATADLLRTGAQRLKAATDAYGVVAAKLAEATADSLTGAGQTYEAVIARLRAELATARRDAELERRDITDAAERREALISQNRQHMDSCIWIDPGRRSGAPCLGGTRLDVDLIAGLMDDGMDGDAIRGRYPDVADEHLTAVRHFVQEVDRERSDAAADALDEAADRAEKLRWPAVKIPQLREWAGDHRAIEHVRRPVPGSPEPAPVGGEAES